jgi:hypothetical protein
MGLYRHPHLVRGIVHTSQGAFLIERGVAEVPDEIGASLGWIRMDEEPQPGMKATERTPVRLDVPQTHLGAH